MSHSIATQNMPTINKTLLETRALIQREIRNFFNSQEFIETDTPSLVFSPGMEPHICPLQIQGSHAFLPTSPEFAMKRLLSQGFHKIFQICKAYRHEPKSQTHNPEFTILEWYRGHSHYKTIMDDVEALFVHLAKTLYGSEKFHHKKYGEQNLSRPWLRLSIEECFQKFTRQNLMEILPSPSASWREKENFNDTFFKIFLNEIEPQLATLGRPVIVHHYPATQAALANKVTDERGLQWAQRFEIYAGGLELGNAFDELVDSSEQRRRFEQDIEVRRTLYGDQYPTSPLDEELLDALSHMPPTGGIAMGVDRLVMYFTSAEHIEDVLWLPSYFKSNKE